MDSDELAAMMNEYFQGAVGQCVHRTDGTVVKYIGDAIFALWNAPEHQADHAARACAAALHFRELSKLPVRGHSLNTRIGLHTGVANVGNFGSEDRVDYTAIGESVNLASRMEGLNKYLGTNCLISGATKKEVGESFVTRRIGLFQLKGYEGLVEVHELVAFPEAAEESRAWREAFATALEHFERRDLVQAQPAFRRVLTLRPDDGPTRHYQSRIAEILAEPDPNWPTHTVLKDK
jgi:adenylate cyclase